MSFDRQAAKDAAAQFHRRRAAQLLGARGGSVKSDRKAAAVRENGKLGGRPRKAPLTSAPPRARRPPADTRRG
jgi:hypothetical protein